MCLMDQLSWQIATLVAHRQQHHFDFESWCLLAEIAPETGRNVERLGTRATLEEITLYSRALGFDIGINIIADEPQTRKLASSCEACGETPVLHKQRHTGTYDRCFDEKIVDLVDALYSVGIKVIDAGQGHTDGRRGGDARLTLSSVAHAQLFYGLCDRARCDIPERAGLRGSLRSSTGAWSCGVSWNTLPGDSHADATVTVRFPHSDIKTLTRLMRNPPRPAFSSLTERSLTERSLITESVGA